METYVTAYEICCHACFALLNCFSHFVCTKAEVQLTFSKLDRDSKAMVYLSLHVTIACTSVM